MNRPFGFFITGTGTNIGKTYVCALLAQTFSNSAPVTYMKPVQTGCVPNEQGDLIAPDFEIMLQGRITKSADYSTYVPYRFEPACSPHLAARMAGQEISLDRIKNCFDVLSTIQKGILLVEGAGGVMVPIGPQTFMIDLISLLGLSVIVVTTPKLGTLNHTILTLSALKSRAIAVAGVVMNNCENAVRDFMYIENTEFIRQAVAPAPFLEIGFECRNGSALEEFCRELV